jgi:hypothetical protein
MVTTGNNNMYIEICKNNNKKVPNFQLPNNRN